MAGRGGNLAAGGGEGDGEGGGEGIGGSSSLIERPYLSAMLVEIK